MNESYTHSVSDIITRLKSALNLTSDAALAKFINTKTNTLSNWKTRNSIDYEIIITICVQNKLDLNWIFGVDIPGMVSEPLSPYKTDYKEKLFDLQQKYIAALEEIATLRKSRVAGTGDSVKGVG